MAVAARCQLAAVLSRPGLAWLMHPPGNRHLLLGVCMPSAGVACAGLSPAQLTALNMDKTGALVAAAGGRWGGNAHRLVGEMQFAFVAFMCGQSLQGEPRRLREGGRGVVVVLCRHMT